MSATRPAVPDLRLTVLYVVGVGHSGSTLLDLLLSTHPSVTSVGEVKNLRLRPEVRCTCGAPDREACVFWQKVGARTREIVGAGLEALDVLGETEDFARHNRALFQAVAEVGDRPVVVDSSKSTRRLAGLLATPGLRVRAIHLSRDPAAVAHSQRRKGRSGLRSAWHWRRHTAETRRILAGREHLALSYDALVASPTSVLARVLAPLGLGVHAGQLAFGEGERHNLGGNRMRFRRDGRIEPDREWQEALGSWQRWAFRAVAGPGPRSRRRA